MCNEKLKSEIENVYKAFFNKLSIDEKSGEYQINKELKFATYPYIGSNYSNAKKRILVVGLDIGKDETPYHIQSFIERNNTETDPIKNANPHIAGTYITSVHFLIKEYGWENIWEEIKRYNTCQQALKNLSIEPLNSPLSFIALTNYYKFVNKGREARSGNANRKYINEKAEKELFLDEVKIFNPDIIIFQGLDFSGYTDILKKINEFGIDIYIAPHPAFRKKSGRKPETYLSFFCPIPST